MNQTPTRKQEELAALFPGGAALGFDEIRNNAPYIDFVRYRTLHGIEYQQVITAIIDDRDEPETERDPTVWHGVLFYYEPNDGPLHHDPYDEMYDQTRSAEGTSTPFDALAWLDGYDYAAAAADIKERT